MSDSFTYVLASDSNAPVLILSAENYSAGSPAYADTTKPAYLGFYEDALKAAGVAYDVYDVDAHANKAPSTWACSATTRPSSGTRADDYVTRISRPAGRHRRGQAPRSR